MTEAREKARGAVHGFLDYTTPLWTAIGIGLTALFGLLGLYILIMLIFH